MDELSIKLEVEEMIRLAKDQEPNIQFIQQHVHLGNLTSDDIWKYYEKAFYSSEVPDTIKDNFTQENTNLFNMFKMKATSEKQSKTNELVKLLENRVIALERGNSALKGKGDSTCASANSSKFGSPKNTPTAFD